MDMKRFVIDNEHTRSAILVFKCALCQLIVVDPQSCPKRHFFCCACIEAHLETHTVCPVDDTPLSRADVQPCDIAISMLGVFTIRCDNRRLAPHAAATTAAATACTWQGSVVDLTKHQQICPYRPAQCPHCHATVLAIYISAHVQYCPTQPTVCDLCTKRVQRSALLKHHEECPATVVYCPNHCVVKHGADAAQARVLRRKDLTAHLKVCSNRIMACELHTLGCKFKGNDDDLRQHASDHLAAHVSLLAKSHTNIRAAIRALGTNIIDDGTSAPAGVHQHVVPQAEDDAPFAAPAPKTTSDTAPDPSSPLPADEGRPYSEPYSRSTAQRRYRGGR